MKIHEAYTFFLYTAPNSNYNTSLPPITTSTNAHTHTASKTTPIQIFSHSKPARSQSPPLPSSSHLSTSSTILSLAHVDHPHSQCSLLTLFYLSLFPFLPFCRELSSSIAFLLLLLLMNDGIDAPPFVLVLRGTAASSY
jgi:hypothetical protein